MSQLSLVFFLIAGLVGMFGAYDRTATGGVVRYGGSLSWAIVALYAFLALIHAIV